MRLTQHLTVRVRVRVKVRVRVRAKLKVRIRVRVKVKIGVRFLQFQSPGATTSSRVGPRLVTCIAAIYQVVPG